MSRSRTVRSAAARPVPITRNTLLRLGLYWGTLFLLAVGGCTLAFWILASVSGNFNIGAQELYFVRGAGLIALALGAAGLFFIFSALRRVSLPTREMMESAERIAQGDYSARVDEQGPRELRSLARSFNFMAEQLRNNEEERRTLIYNIANELRTPLTMLKEDVEGLLNGNFARDDAHFKLILGETIRLSNLVQEMRMLALAESRGLIMHSEPTDLNALVRDTVALYHRDASAHNIGLHAVVPDETLTAMVDPARIQQAIGNLLEDALRAPLKSDIRVELTETETEEDKKTPPFAQIEIAYRASVIAPEQLSGYFERFYRPADANTNTESGLGLAISKLLIQAHGGDISVSSDTRRGTQFRIMLPLDEGA